MSMSRKDYRNIADALKKSLAQCGGDALRDETQAAVALVARNIADKLKADNSAFRYDYFFTWIGLDAWGEVDRAA